MISIPDYRKNIRFEHKSVIMLADKHSGYFASAQMINFGGGGLYFESDVNFSVGTNLQIRFAYPPFQPGPKILRSIVRWCRELTDFNADYTYGVGVKFI